MTVQQAIEANYYTLPELRWRLAVARKKRVPERTLKFWLDELCITPNSAGLYTIEDLQVLIRLVNFLRRCRSIQKFKLLLLQETPTHAD